METMGFFKLCLLFSRYPFQAAVYLQCLLIDASFPSPVLNTVYIFDWAQRMAGFSKFSIHPLVSSMVNASQRIVDRSRVKKDPVIPEVLKALVESKITVKSLFLLDLRSAT